MISPFYGILSCYFYCRGIDFYISLDVFKGHNFDLFKNCFSSLSKLKLIDVQNYKLRLKTLIKFSFNLTLLKLLEILNKEIYNWVTSIGKFTFINLRRELDIYIYKLLWKFVRRLHPRRYNTWIYTKYWRVFSGTYKFAYYDKKIGRFYILKTHTSYFKNSFCFPLQLDLACFFNYRKVFFSFYKKSRFHLEGIRRLLFVKQKGLCFLCFKPLTFCSSKMFINDSEIFYKSYPVQFFLIHNYCLK